MTDTPDRAAPAPPPARRSRRWRWAGRLLGGAVGLVLVLHLPVVQRLLGPLLQRVASVAAGGVVTASSLDFNLWTGHVHATALRFTRPGLEITTASLDVQVRPRQGTVVRAIEPRVVVSLEAEAAPTPPNLRPWTVLDRFAAIDIVRGALRVQADGGSHALQIDGIEAHATRTGGKMAATVVATAVAFNRPEYGWREAADARIEIELPDATQTVHVRSARVVVGQSVLDVTGELQQINPVIGNAHVVVPAAMGLLRTFVPDALLGGLAGEIAARIDFEADRSGRRATLLADASAVRVTGVGPLDGRIAAHLEGDVLRLDDVDLQAYGGSIRGDGVVALDGAASSLQARLRDVDLASVLTAHTGLSVRVASRADADLTLGMSQWDPRTLTTEGTITFRPLAGPGVPLRGSARFSVADRRLHVSSESIRVRDASLRVQGTVGVDGRLDLRYGVGLPDVTTAPAVLADIGVEVLRLNIRGALEAEGTVVGPLDNWVAAVKVAGLQFAVEELDLDIESELKVTPTSVRLVRATATGVDGALSASGDIPMRASDSWNVTGYIERLRLDDALTRLGVPIDASSHGRFEVTGGRSDPRVALTLTADASSRVEGGGRTTALPARVEALAHVSRSGVVVNRLHARAGSGTIEGGGRWAAATGAIEARLNAAAFDLTAIPGLTPVPDLESVLSGEVQVSGTLAAPIGRGSLLATETLWREASLPDFHVDFSSDGREVNLEGKVAQAVLLTGRMPLVAPWPLRLDVDLAALPLDNLLRVFPSLAARHAAATVRGRGLVDIELGSPSRLRYEARVDGAEGSLTQGWKTGSFSLGGDLEAVTVRDLDVEFGVARLRIDGEVGLSRDAGNRLVVVGTAPLSHLALLTPVEEADGELVVDVTMTGRVARPTVAGTVRVAGGMVRQGAFRFDDVELFAAMEEGGVEIREASARIAGGHIRATGDVALQQAVPDRYRLDLHVQGVDVAQLTPTRETGPTLATVVDADMRIVADRLALDAVRGDGSLTRVQVSVDGKTLGLEGPVALAVQSGTLTHAPLRLAGSAGGVTLEATLAYVGGQTQVSVAVDGDVDLVVANPMLGEAVALAGLARVNGRVERDASGWHARGDARVKDGRMVFTDPSVVVSNVTATLRAEGKRIDVIEGVARIGDGDVAVTGHLLVSASGADVNLALRANRVPLEYPIGWRTQSSGDLRLTGQSGAYRLAGEVVVHRAFSELEELRPAPGLDRVSAALAAFEGRGSIRDRTQLDVSVRLEDGLRVASSQINLVVDGAVRVAGTGLTPEVSGSLAFREGSTARVSRALVRLESGRIELAGYPARQPEVEIRGATQVSGVGIDVSLSGPLDDVRMNLSSNNRPDLSQGDLATIILTGRTTSAAASESGAILAEELASSLGRVLNRQLGGFVMIDLARDDSLIPENTNSTLRMSIAIPLSSRLSVIHSRSLDNESLRWVVDFQPGGDFRVRLISNDDGSEAVEVSHRFSFDAWSRHLRPRVVRVRPRIGRVTVDGVSPQEESELRSRLRLTPGGEFDHFRGQDAGRRAQAWLVAQGFLEAAVDVHDEPSPDGRVDLTVHVVRGPLVRIEWRGDNPGRALRARVTAGWSSVLPRDERAARLARDVRRALQSARYFAAAVTAEVIDVASERDAVRVTFDVARGPRGSGVDLRFAGNTAVSDATLAAALPARNTADFFALIEPDGSRRLASALRVAYATEGFLDMRPGTPADAFSGEGGRFTVTIPIVEGDRARVVALELPAGIESSGAAPPALGLRDGEPFRFDDYLSDRARLQTWLRNDGYLYARVTSVLEPRPDGLAVRFQADPGPRVTLGDVRTARDGRTRQSVLENAVATSPGEVIRASSLDDTRERFMETGVFRSVDLRLLPVVGREDVRDVVLDVTERSDINLEYSLRYTTAGHAQVGGAPSESQAGVQLGAGFELVNPFGWADRYRFSGLLGQERRQLNARYDRSTFFGWQVPTEVFLYDDRRRLADAEGLSQQITGATFEQSRRWRTGIDGRRLHERFRMQWGYTIERVEYADFTSFGSTLGGLRAGPIHSFVSDTRDSVTDPRRGVLWSVGSELALKSLRIRRQLPADVRAIHRLRAPSAAPDLGPGLPHRRGPG